ncbi:hypothetical protein FI667_g1067, partial [Globisporangium splendens]
MEHEVKFNRLRTPKKSAAHPVQAPNTQQRHKRSLHAEKVRQVAASSEEAEQGKQHGDVVDTSSDESDDDGNPKDQECLAVLKPVLEHAQALKLGRNLRSFARYMNHSNTDMAARISVGSIKATAAWQKRYAQYRALIQERPRMRLAIAGTHPFPQIRRLESIAAKLYARSIAITCQAGDVEIRGRTHVLGDLCFLSRPSFQSKIAYDERTPNVVPLPPAC